MSKKIPLCYLGKKENIDIDYKKTIDIKFTRDYNINNINILILNKLDKQKNKIPIIEAKISKIKKTLNKEEYDLVDINYYNRKINEYKSKIKNIKSNVERDKYINSTKELLDLYNNTDGDKLDVINDYLDIANKYINLTIHKKEEFNNYCLNCGDEMIYIGDVSNVQRCITCKFEMNMNTNIKAHIRMSGGDEVKPINTSNFKKIIIGFGGKDGYILKKDLESEIDKYFIKRDYKDLSKIKSGRTKDNSISMMRRALKSIGRSDLFKYIYSICNQYFKWERNDIDDIENEIMSLYEKTQIWFRNNPCKKRNSSLNNQWLLYKFCEYLIPSRFKKSDFMIISSSSSLMYHEDRWKQMLKGSNIFS